MSELEKDVTASSMADAEKAMSAIETVVRTLGPLPSSERQKIIQAVLVILGESGAGKVSANERAIGRSLIAGQEDIPSRATLWMKQNGLTFEQLEQVFDISGGVATVIASGVSGKNNADKTIKAYLLTGLTSLLSSGDPVFEDRTARGLCETFGCYDNTNHSKYMKEMGNNFAGSKDKGWKLTAPGLKAAAVLIADLAAGH
jgi:hypothetical protein